MIRALLGSALRLAACLALAGAASAAPAASAAAAKAAANPPAEAEEPDSAAAPYRALVRQLRARSPQDTIGSGAFGVAWQALESGRFDDAARLFKEFSQTYPRNLKTNDALEIVFLIRGNRDFEDRPLKLYLEAQRLHREGRADSAEAVVREGLRAFPGAGLRHHWNYWLAERARERGDHATAVRHALAVADTSSHSRLAPYALRLAADETLASGAGPERAVRLYQELLERYPGSPIAPPVRTRLLELRKKLQL